MSLQEIKELKVSREEILTRMLADIVNTEDENPRSMVYDSISTVSIEQKRFYNLLDFIYKKLDLMNLTGEELETRIRDWSGELRNEATYATGYVVFEGNDGVIIPAGLPVVAGNINFKTDEPVEIIDGRANVKVTCTEAGSKGMVFANAINEIGIATAGVSRIYNPEATINGFDEENDNDFRERFWEKLKYPGKAGNIYHYKIWATDVAGIGDARVIRCYDGPLTVQVILVDQLRKPVTDEKIQEVVDYIKTQIPFGVEDLSVVSAEGFNIDINATIKINGGYSTADIRNQLIDKINEYFIDVGFREFENYISYAKIGAMILSIDGVNDYTDLTINGDIKSINLSEYQTPVLNIVEVVDNG